jgi:hypothetical protein
LKTVISFNQQLRAGVSGDDEETLRRLLRQLQDNVEQGSGPVVGRAAPR